MKKHLSKSLLASIAVSVPIIATAPIIMSSCSSSEEAYPTATDNLIYTLSEDESYYILDSLDTKKDMSKVVIPETYKNLPVKCIKLGVFANNENLQEIYIPQSIVAIGQSSPFSDLELKNLTTIATLTKNTFVGSKNINKVYVDANNPRYKTINSNIIYVVNDSVQELQNDLTNIVYAYGNVTIPENKNNTTIGDHVFKNCSALKTIVCNQYIKTIGDHAFTNCESLTNIGLPDKSDLTSPDAGLLEINNYAFSNCRALASITLPNTLTKIGNYAFA